MKQANGIHNSGNEKIGKENPPKNTDGESQPARRIPEMEKISKSIDTDRNRHDDHRLNMGKSGMGESMKEWINQRTRQKSRIDPHAAAAHG